MTRDLRLYARERPKDWRGFLMFLRDHGFRGMIIEATNGPWLRVADQIDAYGLERAISQFPHPAPFVDEDGDDEEEIGRGEGALSRMIEVAADVGAVELHPDPENGYTTPRRRQQFAEALDACEFSGNVVVTSYPSFQIRDFAREGVSASVQVYDRKDNQPLTFARRWIERWSAYGFQEVRAGVGIYRLRADGRCEPKPLARQKAYLESFPAGVAGDVWTLRSQQLNFRANAAHYQALRDFAAA